MVPTDSASIERGRHFATAIGKCVDCHGENFGGKVMIDHPVLGRVAAANLTRGRGGVGAEYDASDWERAIRHGIGPDGKSLLVMPAELYAILGDTDLAAIMAYLQQLPPVDNELGQSFLRPAGRALLLAGKLPALAAEAPGTRAPHIAPPAPGPTAAYGRYLANVGGCTGCHGPGLSGGWEPGQPPEMRPASNITPTGIGRWTEDDFRRALRAGVRPDGSQIASEMPSRLTKDMTDEEISALYAYLRTVPPRPFGQR